MVASPVTVPIQALHLSPGGHLLIEGVTWEQYERLLEELGEARHTPRINYIDGTLELMSPLPAHERPNRVISDIVKAILDAQDRDWEDFGSTTFRKPERAGLEPDTCFYIDGNAVLMRDRKRLNPESDPPPDLAIEADVTSKTTLEVYEVMGVPEVWIYEEGTLKVYVLQSGQYAESSASATFPSLDVGKLIPQWVQQAFQEGTSTMLRGLRRRLAQ
ncbi:MAG: Uma2 family endonuclease [Cyanobacteria bacterium Co-bin13]|nr:Uma2 family endonuclease [Cyanobacteria bacterium Co-bin13]